MVKIVKNPGNGRLNNLNDPNRPQCVKMNSFQSKSNNPPTQLHLWSFLQQHISNLQGHHQDCICSLDLTVAISCMGREVHRRFLGGNLRERDHLDKPGVDGRIILKYIFKRWNRGMDWIDLDQNWNRWRAVVNAVMKLRVP